MKVRKHLALYFIITQSAGKYNFGGKQNYGIKGNIKKDVFRSQSGNRFI